MLVLTARAERPNLPTLQRLVANATLALQFRCTDKFLHALGTHRVAEVRVPELSRTNTFLLLFDPPTHFQR